MTLYDLRILIEDKISVYWLLLVPVIAAVIALIIEKPWKPKQ